MTAAPQAPQASTGAARKTRERRQRTTARRVAWLAGVFQTSSCHHTAATALHPMDALQKVCDSLQKEIGILRSEVAMLQQRVGRDEAGSDDKAQKIAAQPRASTATKEELEVMKRH